MANQTFTFAAPALPDLNDGAELTLGVVFAVSESVPCIGIQWRVPVTPPSGNCTLSLWNADTQAKLAGKSADFTGLGGTDQQVLFDAPVTLDVGTNYLASVYTPNAYVATTSYTWPQTDGVLTADASNDRFVGWPTEAYPTNVSGNASNYHVGPIVQVTDTSSPSTALLRRRLRMSGYNPGTEGKLNALLTILGTTQPAIWPFWEPAGTLVSGMAPTDFTPGETAGATEALEDDFSPAALPCGLYSYHFHPTGDHHLAGSDHANYSFGNGTVDGPMSVGAWIRPNAVNANAVIAKYDSAGTLREWQFFINSSGQLSLELYDESADATEIGATTSALTLGQWQHAVATYDGGETDPVVTFYVNGAVSAGSSPSTAESGSYVAMENTAAPLTIGCRGVTATPIAEFHGRIALPFLTGKALSATEVSQLYTLTAPMVGVT